jgi:hypothetical protein
VRTTLHAESDDRVGLLRVSRRGTLVVVNLAHENGLTRLIGLAGWGDRCAGSGEEGGHGRGKQSLLNALKADSVC